MAGLQSCCAYFLGVRLSKEEQRSDWSCRPLSDAQLDYAAQDAAVLLALRDTCATWDNGRDDSLREAEARVLRRIGVTHESAPARPQKSTNVPSMKVGMVGTINTRSGMDDILKTVPVGSWYIVRNSLYISLTNQSNSTTLIASRGPSFKMPPSFQPLPVTGVEPDAHQLAQLIVHSSTAARAEAEANAARGGKEGQEVIVTFAGMGEPLLRAEVLMETVTRVRATGHKVKFRVVTNGLFDGELARRLHQCGVDKLTVALAAHTNSLYAEMMCPQGGRGFDNVCTFITAAVHAGMEVECTAIARTGMDEKATRELAVSLGAIGLRVRTYHP